MKLKPLLALSAVCLSAGILAGVLAARDGGETADDSVTPPPESSAVLALVNLQGETVELTALHEQQPLLLNFWATWCPPCLHEIPLLEQVAAAQNAVRVVGVSYEESETILTFMAGHPIAYDIFTTPDDIFDFFSDNGNPSGGMPFSVLINKQGDIIRHKVGFFATAAEVEEFIAADKEG